MGAPAQQGRNGNAGAALVDRIRDCAAKAGFGMGASGLGNLYHAIDDVAARATVDAAWEAGIRYFDTAPFYGFGLSERRLGDALRERPRHDFVLSTKVGRLLRPAAGASARHGFQSAMPFEPVFDYSYDGVMRSFEDSLQRLGLDRIDVLLLHDLGAQTHGADHPHHFREAMNGGYRALDELRAAGVVQAIGMGVNEIAVCEEAMPHTYFDLLLLAGRYTLLDQSADAGFFADCLNRGIAIIAAGVFNSGILATGAAGGEHYFDYAPASAAVQVQAQRLEAVCARHGVPLRAAALQFARAHPAVAAALIGLSSPGEVRQALEAAQWKIPPALWEELRSEGLLPPAPDPPISSSIA